MPPQHTIIADRDAATFACKKNKHLQDRQDEQLDLAPLPYAGRFRRGDIGDEPIIGLMTEIEGVAGAYASIRRMLGQNWVFFRVLDERRHKPALPAAKNGAYPTRRICWRALISWCGYTWRSATHRAMKIQNRTDLT
jgi:hypothetical protein